MSFDTCYQDQNKQFIYVGAYELVLDGIADSYLVKNRSISLEHYKMIKMISDHMELEKDPEYRAVAELLARSDGSAE